MEGAYVTVVSSVDNVGYKVSNTVFLYLDSVLKFRYVVACGWAYTLILLFLSLGRLEELSVVNKKDWCIFKTVDLEKFKQIPSVESTLSVENSGNRSINDDNKKPNEVVHAAE